MLSFHIRTSAVVTHGVVQCHILGPPNHQGASLQPLCLLSLLNGLDELGLLQASEAGVADTRDELCANCVTNDLTDEGS